MTTIDPAVVDELRPSIGNVGQITDIEVCMQHPDVVLSGRHRMEAGATRKHEFDCDAVADNIGCTHEVAHIVVRSHANKQRKVGEVERKEEIQGLCELLEAQGTPVEQILSDVHQLLSEDLSKSRIIHLAPAKYKDPDKSEFGKKGGSPSHVNSAATVAANKPSFSERELTIFAKHHLRPHIRKDGSILWYAYGVSTGSIETDPDYIKARREIENPELSKAIQTVAKRIEPDIFPVVMKDEVEEEESHEYTGNSKRMGESTTRSDTPAENSLQTLLAPFSVELDAHFGQDNDIPVDEDKSYHPDVLIGKWLILEAEGEGSASADNPKREEALTKLGYRLIHIPNRVVKDADMKRVLLQFVELCAELRRVPA